MGHKQNSLLKYLNQSHVTTVELAESRIIES